MLLLFSGLVLLAMLALLALLGTVVRQAVRQGDDRQRARDLQIEAGWRCRALKAPARRLRCHALVRERRPRDSAAVRALVEEAATAR